MVHSISAVAMADKVGREQDRRGNSSGGEHQTGANNFSKVLQQEVEERKADAVHCKTVTYGRDSRLHPFEYFKRNYNPN